MPLPHQCIECDKPIMELALCSKCKNKIESDPTYQPKNCFTMMIGKIDKGNIDNVRLKLYYFGKGK